MFRASLLLLSIYTIKAHQFCSLFSLNFTMFHNISLSSFEVQFDSSDLISINQNFRWNRLNLTIFLTNTLIVLLVNTMVLLWLKLKVQCTIILSLLRFLEICKEGDRKWKMFISILIVFWYLLVYSINTNHIHYTGSQLGRQNGSPWLHHQHLCDWSHASGLPCQDLEQWIPLPSYQLLQIFCSVPKQV